MPKKSFKQNYERLEEIVNELSQEQKDIDQAIDLFKEGIDLYKECSNKLTDAKQKVMKITEESEEEYGDVDEK